MQDVLCVYSFGDYVCIFFRRICVYKTCRNICLYSFAEYQIHTFHCHLCFISIPTPREMQWVYPTWWRYIITSVLSACQLPERICSEWPENSLGTFSLCFISMPAPREDLQWMARKLARCIFTSVFTAFQLPKRICSEWRQKSVGTFSLLFLQHSELRLQKHF